MGRHARHLGRIVLLTNRRLPGRRHLRLVLAALHRGRGRMDPSGRFRGSRTGLHPASSFTVPLQGASQATLTVNHGVGRLELGPGASGPDFMTGNSAAGLTQSSRLMGERLEVEVDAGPSVLPFIGPESGTWTLRLNPAVPTQISLHAGASQHRPGLLGASGHPAGLRRWRKQRKVSLPAKVDRFNSHIRTGASSIQLSVPSGTAARIVLSRPRVPYDRSNALPSGGSRRVPVVRLCDGISPRGRHDRGRRHVHSR